MLRKSHKKNKNEHPRQREARRGMNFVCSATMRRPMWLECGEQREEWQEVRMKAGKTFFAKDIQEKAD